MPLRLDIKRQLVQRTDRIKGVDLHPTEPWLLANLYNGNVYIWNWSDQTLVKSFEITELPVRSAKFVARKQWLITGSDDMIVRIFNYNTMDKVKVFEAHTDYIRCIAVHPSMPYILTSSDDMLIKLWDWDKNWSCAQVFEGHSHYVMMVSFNPKDSNTFASASLDRTIKVWCVGQPTPNFTLEGHEKGVNCVDYFTGGDRPYLISGADDKLVKVWDYQTKACVQTLEGHSHNIAAVCFHPELPIIVSGSEDGTIKLWHSTTYRLENTLDYRLERVWSLGYVKGSNCLAIGYDDGAVVLKLGREEPVASMDSSGKIIWAKHNEVQTVNLRSLGAEYEIGDGERLPLAVKDLGSCDLYPQTLSHNPNGRFVVVCGDGEYIVYTALAWRNKSFGSGLEFVWSHDSNDFAIRESPSKVKLYKNFAEKNTVKLDFTAEGIHGGALVGVRSAEYIVFFDWDGSIVRRIDVVAKEVRWSESGEYVAIIAENSFYVLKFNREVVEAHRASGRPTDDDGIDDAFELLNEVSEKVKTGVWVGGCFIYNNAQWRLNYCVGGEVTTLYHLDRPMYLLGYLAAQNRVFLIDKEFGIVSYTLLLSMIEFKTLAQRGDMEAALALLPGLPKDQLNGVARFLEAKGFLGEALDVATDPEYRFDLALQLGNLDVAQSIAVALNSEVKWKQLGELAVSSGRMAVAEQCLQHGKDFSGLLLLYSAQANRAGLTSLAASATAAGKHNVAFLALFSLGQVEQCVQLLLDTNRLPEAAFFARTYLPSKVSEVCKVWKKDLALLNPKAAESLADPDEYPNLFPELALALKAESVSTASRSRLVAASRYAEFEGSTLVNLIEAAREMGTTSLGNGHAEAEEDEQLEEEDEEVEEEQEAEETPAPAPAPPAQLSAPPPPPSVTVPPAPPSPPRAPAAAASPAFTAAAAAAPPSPVATTPTPQPAAAPALVLAAAPAASFHPAAVAVAAAPVAAVVGAFASASATAAAAAKVEGPEELEEEEEEEEDGLFRDNEEGGDAEEEEAEGDDDWGLEEGDDAV
ncbi:MAG: hypothetical protein WDW36_008326 [Sanguina aurantia]